MLCTRADLLPVKIPKGSIHVENRRSIRSITDCSEHISCKSQKIRKERTLEEGTRKCGNWEKNVLLEEEKL